MRNKKKSSVNSKRPH